MALTCLKRVVDFGIGSLVLIERSDLYNLCAHCCRVQHFCFVMDGAELRGVKVAVLHVDDDPNKVPLDGHLLVPYLDDREEEQVRSHLGSRQSSVRWALTILSGPLQSLMGFTDTNPSCKFQSQSTTMESKAKINNYLCSWYKNLVAL